MFGAGFLKHYSMKNLTAKSSDLARLDNGLLFLELMKMIKCSEAC